MRVGIFGGAFNPIHNGHLHLISCFKKELSLDKIVLIPTSVPPHKTSTNLAPAQDRLNMLRLAVGNDSSIDISDIEFKRAGKSYTYDTLKQLRTVYPNDSLYLIVGADQFFDFKTWYRASDILKDVTVCTAARQSGDEKQRLVNFKNSDDELKNCIICDFDAVVVSSSEVRQKIKDGQSVDALIPLAVEKYIRDNNLYV